MANITEGSLSIIDAYIQIFQRERKNASLQQNACATASIKALETLWDDLSSVYTKKRASKLCKPDGNDLLYRKSLNRDSVYRDASFCEVIQLHNEDIRFTLLVAVEKERSRYIFTPLEEVDSASRVRSFDKISYTSKMAENEEGAKMVGFLYPRVELLKDYHDKTHLSDFPKIIKGLIVSITNLETKLEMEKGDEYTIRHDLCVVQDGQIGSMLFLSHPAEMEMEQERKWRNEYRSLERYLHEIFDIERAPYGFRVVVECMGLAWSKGRRVRLLKSPYFLSDDDKIMKFIPLMNAVVWICDQLKKLIRDQQKYHRWFSKVYRQCGDEVDDVLVGKKYGNDGISFLQFLFNCVKHLKSTSASEKVKKIMEIISKVDGGFLDHIFLLTYRCNWNIIPMLDLPQKESLTVQGSSSGGNDGDGASAHD